MTCPSGQIPAILLLAWVPPSPSFDRACGRRRSADGLRLLPAGALSVLEGGEMRAVNSALARCLGCDETMSQGFFDALLRIRPIPVTEGKVGLNRGNPYKRGSGGD